MTDPESDGSISASEEPSSLVGGRRQNNLDDERFLVDHCDASPGSECGDDPNPSSYPSQIPLRRTNLPTLTGAILASGTTGGITYAFGLYSSALKHTLHLSQSELDTISSAFFCAGLLSWAPGMASDKFGPRRTLAAGGITGALALLGFFSVARQYVPVPRSLVVPVLSALGVGSFMSSALVTGAVFKLIVSSTGPGTKGSAVGSAKGYVGLGAGAYACLFEALRGGGAPPPVAGEGGGGDGGSGGDVSDLNFLPMAAVLAVIVGTLPAIFLIPPNAGTVDPNPRRKKPEDAATPLHFRTIYAGLLGLGAVVVGTSVMELYDDSSDKSQAENRGRDDEKKEFGERDLGRAALVLGMWLLPIISLLCLPRKSRSADMAASEGELEEEPAAGGSLLEEARTGQGVPHRLQRGRKRREGSRYVRIGTGEDSKDQDEDVDLNYVDEGCVDEEDCNVGAGGTFGRAAEVCGDEEESASTGSELATGVELSRSGDAEDADQVEHLIHGEEDGGELGRSRPHATCGRENSATEHEPSASSAPRPLGELPLSGMLRTSPAWLLLWTCTILCGGGTVITNNVGQMAEALRLEPDTAPAALALFSAAQAAGRVCTGAISESALNWKKRVPRPAFLMAASVFGFASHTVLALASTEMWFVAGVAMTGWAFGMIWPLMVLIVGETFGTRNVGANYMFYDGVTSAAGTLLLSKFVAQEVYESHIQRDHSIPGEDAGAEWGLGEDDGLTCFGMGCFQLSHAVVAGLSLTCICSSAALMYKTREVYEQR